MKTTNTKPTQKVFHRRKELKGRRTLKSSWNQTTHIGRKPQVSHRNEWKSFGSYYYEMSRREIESKLTTYGRRSLAQKLRNIRERWARGEISAVEMELQEDELYAEFEERIKRAELNQKNYGSSTISQLLDRAKEEEIQEVMKKGGGSLTLPMTKKEINEETRFIIRGEDPPIMRGKSEKGMFVKENIELGEGKFIPKQIILPGTTVPLTEHRKDVNIYAQDRRKAKQQFKETGKFEGWQEEKENEEEDLI